MIATPAFRHIPRPLAIASALLLAAGTAPASGPNGLLPGGGPLELVHRQSLYAGYFEDRVGSAVSLSGDLLAVGVPGSDAGPYFDAGRVDVYRWFDVVAGWALIQSYTTQSFGIAAVANARFGAALSLSGEWLLVGCPGCDPADEANAILLRIPDTIEAIGEPRGVLEWYRATPPDLLGYNDPIEGTGAAVALSVVRSGTLLDPGTSVVFAVGSPQAEVFVIDTPQDFVERGAVAMGRLDVASQAITWESDAIHGDADFGKYGKRLAMAAATWVDLGVFRNQRLLVVGEPGWVSQGGFGVPGRAVLWQRDGSNWTSAQTFTASAPGFFDGLGSALAVERASNEALGTIALGAPGRSVDGTPGGSVLVFRQQAPDGPYVFDQEFQHPAAELADRYGGALALSAGRLLVGADGRARDSSPNAGAAYLYRREFNLLIGQFSWQLKQSLGEPDEPGGDAGFGAAIAIGPRASAIGAPLSDAAGIVNAGRVATYLCDHIFSDGIEGGSGEPCAGP